jgi:hypothetical protein
MRKILLTVICVTSIGLFASIRAQSQEQFDEVSLKDRGSLSPEQLATLQSRRNLIIAEASTLLANEWVGSYGSADSPTSGARLDWAPANGFLVLWNTCSYGWSDRVNFGSVDFRDGVLRVTPELNREGEKVYSLSGDLIPVKWGNQHYLIPLDRLIAFCYAVRNTGRSFEIQEFFLKESDRDKRRFGLPAVPPAYKKYLVGPPIQATIIAVKSRVQRERTNFTLNTGRTAGVVPGMKFFAVSPRNVYMLVEVSNVSDDSAEGFVIMSGFRNHSQREVKLRIGWKLTSRAPRDAGNYYPG